MKKYIGILLMSLFVASCAQQEMYDSDIDSTLYAEIEQPAPDDLTKTYYDTDSDKVLWDNGDLLTLFTGTSAPLQYEFVGGTGVTGGKLILSDNSGASSGDAISHNYAVYPYSEYNGLDGSERIVIKTSGVQTYPGFDSFGENDNIMVAASDNTSFSFKNACGWIILGLSGEGQVSSITLQGNANEIIAGDFAVTATVGGNPAIEPRVKGTKFTNLKEITLECPDPVTLSSTMTDFWIVVPPTVFSSGFSFTVTDPTGRTCTKDVPVSYTVERAKYRRIATTVTFSDPVQNIEFADERFKAYCVENFDEDGDGEISVTEASKVTSIDVNKKGITSMRGVECFTALTELNCYANQLSSLDVSKNTALTALWCDDNQLTSLDVSKNTALRDLYCGSNPLSSLDVSNNTALTKLWCSSNQLTSLDVSNNTALTELRCTNNQLTCLDVSNNTALTLLECDDNQLMSLDVRNNTALTVLWCQRNQLTSLDVSNNTALTTLYCGYNQLTRLDVSGCTALTELHCVDNQLTSLDVSNNTALTTLWCYNNQLTSLDVSNNTALTSLSCYNNQLTSLDVSNNTALTEYDCRDNQLTSLNVSGCTMLRELLCDNNQLTSLDVSNNTALTTLYCSYNQLTSLDVSNNTELTSLYCDNNQLSSLDISNNTLLYSLYCVPMNDSYGNNLLQYIYVSNGQALPTTLFIPSETQIVVKDNEGISIPGFDNIDM